MVGEQLKGLNGGENLFKKAKFESKMAGKLLACTLAARVPFFTETISFIGHSLGCQVIKSCIKQLHELGMNDLVENVTFLAGAASCFDKEETSKDYWSEVLSKTVNGVIRNVHTPDDHIIKTYVLTEGCVPLGRQRCYYGDNALSDKYLNKGSFKEQFYDDEKDDNFS
jgi:hypothetical protein